jgi:hypothetical protein
LNAIVHRELSERPECVWPVLVVFTRLQLLSLHAE